MFRGQWSGSVPLSLVHIIIIIIHDFSVISCYCSQHYQHLNQLASFICCCSNAPTQEGKSSFPQVIYGWASTTRLSDVPTPHLLEPDTHTHTKYAKHAKHRPAFILYLMYSLYLLPFIFSPSSSLVTQPYLSPFSPSGLILPSLSSSLTQRAADGA